jgi:hypothetical protein
MATLKLVSPDPGAVYWRAAIGNIKGVSAEPVNSLFTFELLRANYYKITVEEMDGESEVIKTFPIYEEYMTLYGDYQINAQTGGFSQIS